MGCARIATVSGKIFGIGRFAPRGDRRSRRRYCTSLKGERPYAESAWGVVSTTDQGIASSALQ